MIRLFVDLDGVLVDFESGVKSIFGKYPDELSSKEMWSKLSGVDNFFSTLSWMSDGRHLWDFVKDYQPTILSGTPFGKWAAPQKHDWCARELGEDVPVLTCLARDKPTVAALNCNHGDIKVLIDDRQKNKDPWIAHGGIFIHHKNAVDSIEKFTKLLSDYSVNQNNKASPK